MFDDGSATSLLSQDYGVGSPPATDDEPPPQGAPSEGPLYTEDLPDGGEVDPVVVTGPGTQTGGGTSGGGDFNWETDTTWLDPNAPEDLPTCTPPPDGPTPDGVDMGQMRRTARDMADDAADNDRDQEWAGIIWRDASGTLHATNLLGSGNDHTPHWPLGEVGNGGVIVAIFHTHPDRNDGTDQGRLSRIDSGIFDDLASAGAARGITVDANAMSYVNANATNPENDELREFDSDDAINSSGTLVGGCGGGVPLGS